MTASAQTLFCSPLVRLSDHTCDTLKSGCGRERSDPASSLTIIRRGVHAHHARGRVALAEAGRALVYRGGEAYSLSHPYHRDVPDRSTCIEFDGGLLEEAFGARPLVRDLGVPLRPSTQLLGVQVTSALDGKDRLAAEEVVLTLVRAVSIDFGLSRESESLPSAARRRVDRARAFIAAEPAANHGIEAVAAAAACSPFHLARLFRRRTGMTIRGYRRRLRLASALQDLADGATDLSSVAMRSGFADHSHMTTTFRTVFGSTPRALRERLGGRALARQSTFLQATAEPQT